MVDIAGATLTAEDCEILLHPQVGGFIIFTRNYVDPEQVRALVASVRDLRESLLVAVDYEGGRVQRFRKGGFTVLPAARVFGRIYDEDPARAMSLARSCGWLIGTELGAIGADLSFSPVLDLDGSLSTVIGDRAFHPSPEAIGQFGLAHMHGLRDAGMAATGKHFPGHGRVVEDSHESLPVDERDIETIRREDMRPFEILIQAGLPSIMMAHILFPAVDRLPSSLSRHWIMGELRGRLGFHGAVFCDDVSMKGAETGGSYTERATLALEAGCDMLPVCNKRTAVVELLDNLRRPPDRLSSARLERLRGARKGRPLPELQQDASWQAAFSSLSGLA
jgi:beta-N-acetylhexosaminidase